MSVTRNEPQARPTVHKAIAAGGPSDPSPMGDADPLVVIHSVPGVWLGQTETWLYNQVRFLPPRVTSHVICEGVKNLDQFAVPNIHDAHQMPPARRFVARALRKLHLRRDLGLLPSVAAQSGASVLHSHFGYTGWRHCRTARRLGLKHVVTFYGVDVNHFPRLDDWPQRYYELFRLIDLVLCEGPHMASCIVKLGCPEEKVRVHRLGVDISEIAYRPRVWAPPEPLRVLLAARFRQKKGIPYALEALGRLKDRLPLEVTIIGDAAEHPEDQVEKRRILEIIGRYGLGPKVRMLGFRPYPVIFEEAYKSHVFLQTSVTADSGDTEGGAPVCLIEMMATGMPVVSTTHCDIPNVLDDASADLLAPERDVDGIARALLWLAEHPADWPRITAAGRRRAETHFDAHVQAESLAATYEELLGRTRAKREPTLAAAPVYS